MGLMRDGKLIPIDEAYERLTGHFRRHADRPKEIFEVIAGTGMQVFAREYSGHEDLKYYLNRMSDEATIIRIFGNWEDM